MVEIPITKLIDEVEHDAIRAACPLAIYFLSTTLVDEQVDADLLESSVVRQRALTCVMLVDKLTDERWGSVDLLAR